MKLLIGFGAGLFFAGVMAFAFLTILPDRHNEAIAIFVVSLAVCIWLAHRARSIRASAALLLGMNGLVCLAASAFYVWSPRSGASAHVGFAGAAAVGAFVGFGAAFLLAAFALRSKASRQQLVPKQ